MSTVWNMSIGQLGLSVWLCSLSAPAHWIMRNSKNSLISQQQLKPSVLPTFFSYYIQNTAATGRKINSSKTQPHNIHKSSTMSFSLTTSPWFPADPLLKTHCGSSFNHSRCTKSRCAWKQQERNGSRQWCFAAPNRQALQSRQHLLHPTWRYHD